MTTTTVSTDTIRYRFLAHAQRDAGLNLEEAELVADFFTGIGEEMLGKLTPILVGYRERISNDVRNKLIDEIVERLKIVSAFTFSKRYVLDLLGKLKTED